MMSNCPRINAPMEVALVFLAFGPGMDYWFAYPVKKALWAAWRGSYSKGNRLDRMSQAMRPRRTILIGMWIACCLRMDREP